VESICERGASSSVVVAQSGAIFEGKKRVKRPKMSAVRISTTEIRSKYFLTENHGVFVKSVREAVTRRGDLNVTLADG